MNDRGPQNTTAKKIRQKRMLEALESCLGIVTVAAKQIGVDRSRHYEWLKEPEYARQVAELENVALDFAESQLHKQIRQGSTSATIFYLKTKGKKRGFVEQTNLDLTSLGQSLAGDSAIDLTRLSPETLRELREQKLLDAPTDEHND